MSILERQAWFVIKVILLTVLLYLVVGACTQYNRGALGIFGLIGLLGFVGMIGRRERNAGKVVMDERDLAISRKATLIGYSVFWLFFVAGMLMPFFLYGPQGTITIGTDIPAFFVNASLCLIFLTRSVAILILYRRPGNV